MEDIKIALITTSTKKQNQDYLVNFINKYNKLKIKYDIITDFDSLEIEKYNIFLFFNFSLFDYNSLIDLLKNKSIIQLLNEKRKYFILRIENNIKINGSNITGNNISELLKCMRLQNELLSDIKSITSTQNLFIENSLEKILEISLNLYTSEKIFQKTKEL